MERLKRKDMGRGEQFMKYTTNYNLKKPEEIDNINIGDFNLNADTIDGKLKENADALLSHQAETASKHIAESGSNANGRYIKFDDGTMICYRYSILSTGEFGEVRTWIFPAMFSTASNLFVRHFVSGDDDHYTEQSVEGVANIVISHIRQVNQSAATTQSLYKPISIPGFTESLNAGVSQIAIGRWK